jgi:hypothetical protein
MCARLRNESAAGRRSGHAKPLSAKPSRRITWIITIIGVLAVAAGVVITGGVALGRRVTAPTPAAAPPLHVETYSATPDAPPPPTSANPDIGRLATDFARLQTTLNAKVGLVLRPVGPEQSSPTMFGDWPTGAAWSTIKVPLVIAAMRAEQDPSQVTDAMRAAITQSDNAAAEQIWEGLGDPTAAADAVQRVLQEYGDPTTVQSQKERPEFSAFGQSEWTLTDQSRFLAAAACDDRNAAVLDLMGQIEGDQQWGLGVISDAQFKGGWGPSQSGNYLVRQMGIIPTPNGLAVAAIAAEPASGSFADGIAALTAIAHWLDEHRSALPASQCP